MDNTSKWREASTPPEKEGNYLVYLSRKEVVVAVYEKNSWYYLDSEDRYWYNCSRLLTHWTHLPKPPGE